MQDEERYRSILYPHPARVHDLIPWDDVSWAFSYLKKTATIYSRQKLFDKIADEPLDVHGIEQLVKQGWRVVDSEIHIGSCSEERKEIGIEKGAVGYWRDIILFHELAHAHFGEETRDNGIRHHPDNVIVLAYLERLYRCQAALLRHAVYRFHLTPFIYDNVSYRAFRDDVNAKLLSTKNLALLQMNTLKE